MVNLLMQQLALSAQKGTTAKVQTLDINLACLAFIVQKEQRGPTISHVLGVHITQKLDL